MGMAYTTWQAMSGNGVLIGMVKATTLPPPIRIHKGRTLVHKDGECCVGVLGPTVRSACVLLTASSAILIIGSTPTDFAVCQDFRTAGPFTPVRAQHGLYCFTTCW